MKARDVLAHFQTVGHWVDWDDTCDQFLHGDPDVEVEGIATAWIPTNKAIQQAAEQGCNLFITHEPAFYYRLEGMPGIAQLAKAKRDLLDKHEMTLLRCHDTWDRMPEYGIPDSWARFLGFRTEERPVELFYRTCLPDSITVERAAQLIAERVSALGQDVVLVFGDQSRVVDRMVVGTGAITRLPLMYELEPDLILATDDGMKSYAGWLWATDLDIPVIIVNHATSEKPGMMAMAQYLETVFDDIPVVYVDVGPPYKSVRATGAD